MSKTFAFSLSLFIHFLVIVLIMQTEFLPPLIKQEGPLIAEIITPVRAGKKEILLKELKRKTGAERLESAGKKSQKQPAALDLTYNKPQQKSAVTPLPQKKIERPLTGLEDNIEAVEKSYREEERKDLIDIPTLTPQDKETSQHPSQDTQETEGMDKPQINESGRSAKGQEIPMSLPTLKDLFDPEVIGDIAKSGLKKEEEEKKELEITLDLKFESYKMRLKERIESIWVYPAWAKERGIYGDLYINFTIKKDGHLGAVELLRTSGYRELDEAALKALRNGEPYWPLPAKWGEEAITITGHFIYTHWGIVVR